ncbi:hypothetical protein [Kribbella lupini]|uniref:Carboxypeptidase regulatory-like domain-containing protein n=1 Tax=Kribbella lupini TaxID=291602 RepID=A0ABP4MII2_9ACTN
MLTLALAPALLLSAVAVPLPAAAADATISNVKISWYDAEHTKVLVTWQESAPVANIVRAQGYELGTTTAKQPDRIVAETGKFPQTGVGESQQVLVVGPDGTEARSVPFDSYTYAPKELGVTFPSYDRLRWTVAPDQSVDSTPNDPLDLPVSPRYQVTVNLDPDLEDPGDWACAQQKTFTAIPSGTVTKTGRTFDLRVSPVNEWGTSPWAHSSVPVGAIDRVTIAAPVATPYGGTTTLTGHLGWRSLIISGAPPTCNDWLIDGNGSPVVVQQRTSPTAPWTVVGTTRTDAKGNYKATFRNPGHREYRVVAPNVTSGWLRFGGDSATVAVRATTRVVSGKFIQPVINLGTRPQAYLWVDPAGTQKAALQFKNAAGAWQGVAYKTLYAGRGLLAFPWNKRGTTQFRWWVPASAAADATYSNSFTLTVR